MHNLSYGNKFDLQDNERARETHSVRMVVAQGLFSNRGKSKLGMVSS